MEWREVKGFEGFYEVSDTGRVRSVNRNVQSCNGVNRHLCGREMKITRSKNKHRHGDCYYVVNLRKHGKSFVKTIHSLVADAFIPNPENHPTVNHIDGNKGNNHVSNLEWVSYKDNNIHALYTGLRKPRGVKISQETIDGEFISMYKSVCEASRETGISRGSISHCVNGYTKSAGGFIWKKCRKCNDYPVREYTGG